MELECVSCEAEIKDMEHRTELVEKEHNELRKKYYNALVENFKKDREIESLEDQLKPKYTSFEDILPEDTMQVIRSLKNTGAKDSKFILTALRGLYVGRLNDLKNINLSGRSKINNKKPMTPEKKTILKKLLKERTNNTDERVNQLNRYIKAAIESINKTNN